MSLNALHATGAYAMQLAHQLVDPFPKADVGVVLLFSWMYLLHVLLCCLMLFCV